MSVLPYPAIYTSFFSFFLTGPISFCLPVQSSVMPQFVNSSWNKRQYLMHLCFVRIVLAFEWVSSHVSPWSFSFKKWPTSYPVAFSSRCICCKVEKYKVIWGLEMDSVWMASIKMNLQSAPVEFLQHRLFRNIINALWQPPWSRWLRSSLTSLSGCQSARKQQRKVIQYRAYTSLHQGPNRVVAVHSFVACWCID